MSIVYYTGVPGVYPFLIYGVIAVWEDTDKREGAVDANFLRTYKREFIVQTDNPLVGCKAVALAFSRATGIGIGTPYFIGAWDPIANIGDFYHEADPGSFCRSLIPKVFSADGANWKVSIEYGPWDPRIEENPLDKKLELEWDWVQFEKIADVDRDGKAVVNSAGDYFDPPIVMDDSRPILRIVRNEPDFSMAYASDYRDSINDGPWYGYPAYTVKCTSITAKLEYSMNIPGDNKWYWTLTYVFHLNPDGWDKEVLDQGLRSSGGEPIIKGGVPATSPVLLDGAGEPAASGADASYLKFGIYKTRDFVSAFNFDGADATT